MPNLDGSFRVYANYIPNFGAAAAQPGAKFAVGDFAGTGSDCIAVFGNGNQIVLAVGQTDGTFREVVGALDPAFAYYTTLPGLRVLTGNFADRTGEKRRESL